MKNLVFVVSLVCLVAPSVLADVISDRLYNKNQTQFDGTVTFVVYLSNGTRFNLTGTPDASKLASAGCEKQNWAIFSHGWGGSCFLNDWVPNYVTQMKVSRGGCIICFDYYNYSVVSPYNGNYFALTQYFPNIVTTLTEMLTSMQTNGYNFSAGYGYGFSFGAQAMNYGIYRATGGSRIIPQVDLCEKAGVGDGYYMDINTLPDPKLAAKFVSCVHTSSDRSTQALDCHQNWRMGNCGTSQAAAGSPPMGNHGLCPYFWDCAFTYNFPAIVNPNSCTNSTDVAPPPGLRFGYPWKNTALFGNFYANTGKNNCYSSP